MVAVIIKRNTSPENNYLQNACEYVLDERAIALGGFGVTPYSATDAYSQMQAERRYFNKESMNPLIHIIISYDQSVIDADTAARLSRQCASFFSNSYQVLYCAHEKDRSCSNYHTHLVINAVSFVNGAMFNSGIQNMQPFCDFVATITGKYCKLYFE